MVKVLCIVEREKPPMAYVFEAIQTTKELIKSFYDVVENKYGPIQKVIDKCWTN